MTTIIIWDKSYRVVETDEVVRPIGGRRFTERSAMALAHKLNATRMSIKGTYMLRYEVKKLGRFRYEVVALQNKLVRDE